MNTRVCLPMFFTAALATLLVATNAYGHPGHTDATGLLHGFAHPTTGLDHILAMVAVGLLAVQIGGRAIWALPLSFLAMMAVGGAMGVAGVPVPGVEHGIVFSVLVLGAMIAFAVRLPLPLVAGVVGMMAIFHGHAHGAEMPETASGLSYGMGFTLGTALLHTCGVAAGLLLMRRRAAAPQTYRLAAVRLAGVTIALSSLYLWFGA